MIDLQVVAQRRVELELNLTAADLVIGLLCALESTRRDRLVLGARIYRRGRLEELEETLHDHAFKKLSVARLIVCKSGDLGPRRGEKVLQMLLSAV
jgi:hypothetical protein